MTPPNPSDDDTPNTSDAAEDTPPVTGVDTAGDPVAAEDGTDPATNGLFIVGIGASAGGLEAASTLVQNLPPDANAVYVLAQHMSPTHKSLLTPLLARETPLPVEELTGKTEPRPNTIFITPPNTDVILQDDMLVLVEPSGHPATPKPSADRLFKSLAKEMGENCVGVVLSGTGSDGSYGVQAIREAGGITIAQDIATAKYDGMPASAAETGCIDLTLSPERIGQHLTKILSRPRDFDALRRLGERPTKLSDLFQILLARTNVDFRDYKENTVTRRINRRMAALDIEDYDDYVAYCRTSGVEVEALFRDLLISVTRFFRDRSQFDQLQKEFKALVARKDTGQFRLWIAGCATGEEVYSVAIMLSEALGGLDQLKKSRIQIFATDIDDRALEVARRGSYPITAAADIPQQFLDTYFTVHDGRIEVAPELRAVTLFSLHNIFHDPPFLNVDFVSIRNVLIYFNQALQNRVLHRMHYALNPDGLLFLGTSETVGNLESLFETRMGSEKIYAKRLLSQNYSPRFDLASGTPARKALPAVQGAPRPEQPLVRHPVESGLFDTLARAVAPNGFIVTRGGEMVRVFGDISHLTQLTENAPLWIGIRNLRKPLRDEITGLVTTALKNKERRTGRWQDIEHGHGFNQARSVCYPLPASESGEDHVLVALETRTKADELDAIDTLTEPEQRAYVRRMELEIAQTREALQQTVEELQTSNEELQSINEEMQSTNEELQATNEELETSNEELQSTNEELITVNEELQVNSAELQRVSTELAATLDVVPFPMMVIDQALIVRRASRAAMSQFQITDLPGTGVHLSQCRLPDRMSDMAAICNEVFTFREERRVTFDSGRTIKQLTVTPFRNQSDDITGVVATVVDDILTTEAVSLLQKFGNIGYWQIDLQTNTTFFSEEVYRIYGLDPAGPPPSVEDGIGYYHPDDRETVQRMVQNCVETGEPFQFTTRLIQKGGGIVVVESAGIRVSDGDGTPVRMVGVFRNVTESTAKAHLMAQLETLQSGLDLAFYSYDIGNEVAYWSSGLYKMLGKDPETFQPTFDNSIEIFHPDDRARVLAYRESAMESGKPYEYEARLVHKDGTVLDCLGHGETTVDANGRPTHLFGRLQLVTEPPEGD